MTTYVIKQHKTRYVQNIMVDFPNIEKSLMEITSEEPINIISFEDYVNFEDLYYLLVRGYDGTATDDFYQLDNDKSLFKDLIE